MSPDEPMAPKVSPEQAFRNRLLASAHRLLDAMARATEPDARRQQIQFACIQALDHAQVSGARRDELFHFLSSEFARHASEARRRRREQRAAVLERHREIPQPPPETRTGQLFDRDRMQILRDAEIHERRFGPGEEPEE